MSKKKKNKTKKTEKNKKNNDNRENLFKDTLKNIDFNATLDPKIKKEIKWLIEMLDDFYSKKIEPPTATIKDAVDYIPLFYINGALISSLMDIPYDDYLKLVDIMIVALNIEKEEI